MIARDKEMYVIGHYHVAPNHHVMIPPSWHNLRMQHGRGRWPKLFGGALRRASQRTRRIVSLEYAIQPQRLIMTHFMGVAAGCRCSSRCLSGRILSRSAAGDGGSYNTTDTPPDKQYSAPSSGRNSKSKPLAKRSRPLRSWPAPLPLRPLLWSILCDRK